MEYLFIYFFNPSTCFTQKKKKEKGKRKLQRKVGEPVRTVWLWWLWTI